MNLATHKCCVLHIGNVNPKHKYSINGIKLTNVTEVADLGVTVDSKLRFDNHISRIVT